MNFDQVIALISAVVMNSADPDFNKLRNGGATPENKVSISRCDASPGELEVEGKTYICGTVDVPEDYANAQGTRIPIKFGILKSLSDAPAGDPVVYLHGGPGSGTLLKFPLVAEKLFKEHRRTRDIVLFDQRAAALSSVTVRCHEQVASNIVDLANASQGQDGAGILAQMVGPCINEMKADSSNLPAYNTFNNAKDVRTIMSALGYPDYNIVGISYGSRLALEVLRTTPEGVRSVVIDGVAPPTVRIYDDFFTPYADALDALVLQCEDDDECAKAYPDLLNSINKAFEKLGKKPIEAARGKPAIDVNSLFQLTFPMRNSWRDDTVITPYLPRIFAELAEGKSDTFDAITKLNEPTPLEQITTAGGLTDSERDFAKVVIESVEASEKLEQVKLTSLAALKASLSKDNDTLSVAEAFERRSTEAAKAIKDRDAVALLLRDYAMMRHEEPSRSALSSWVIKHFEGDDRQALINLVEAMSEEDLNATWRIADSEVDTFELLLANQVDLAIYACQEDVPWNSVEGYMARNKKLGERYPLFYDPEDRGDNIFGMCEAISPQKTGHFHEPVSSDVPVLSLNGTLDIQTSMHWGAMAVETLSNAQNLIVPEAGHGTIAYQKCANDISVAFINAPEAPLNTSCIDDIEIDFLLPDEPLP
jgi:pimeloyl-ACP methyl ester carboxylesterase